MRKKDKSAENKKKEPKLKVRWKIWMTIVAVVAGVFAISGATVLGVYLTGGFDEKVVSPEGINFSYDDGLFNAATNQIETGEDFQLTIVATNEGVTQRKVSLSFTGGSPTTVLDGKVSNGVIEVPQEVILGRPFTVHLVRSDLRDDDGTVILDHQNNPVQWIAGGLASLRAQSEYIQINPAFINVAVDVPVYSTETLIINSKGEVVSQVVKNESFTLRSKYLPSKSLYMYSDNLSEREESAWRLKKSYYEPVSSDSLTTVYDSMHEIHLLAGDQMAQNIRINSYTFSNAKAQIDYEREFASEEGIDNASYYQSVLRFLSENQNLTTTSHVIMAIGEENIGRFTVNKSNVSMKAEQPLNLYLNNYSFQSDSDYLGVNVYSSSGLILDNLLKNIAINFELDGKDPTIENKILNVSGGDFVTIGGKRYYRPNSKVSNVRYSYWTLSATEAANIKMNIALIVGDDQALFEQTEGTALIREVVLEITKHVEGDVAWTDQSDIDVLLQYSTTGGVSTIVPKNVDLEEYAFVPEDNIYQDKVFFASFGNGDINDYISSANEIIGENGYIRSASGVYTMENGQQLTLFAINGSRLTLYNTGVFTLYFATVKPELSESGLYNIVEMSSGYKRINCKKSLYTDSVYDFKVDTALFPVVNNETSINQGSDYDFGIGFNIGSESVPVFKDEFQKGLMKPVILDVAGNDISELFTFNDGVLTNATDSGEAYLEYRVRTKSSVQINEIQGIRLGYISLNYDNGEDEPINWTNALTDRICVYKPTAMKIELTENDISRAINGGNKVKVEQSLNNDGLFRTAITISLTADTSDVSTNVTDFINKLVGARGAYLTITDQKGKTETLSGQWSFALKGGNMNIITLSADGKSFTFRNTQSDDFVPLSLVIKSADGNSTLLNEDGEEFIINFDVKSTGLTKIAYDSADNGNYDPYVANPSKESEDTSKAVVTKYGASSDSNAYLDLKEVIKFYCKDETGNDVLYNLITFKFSPQYYSVANLSDKQIQDLFGLNGMLELYNDAGPIDFRGNYLAENIRNILATATITKIYIKKNFASAHTIQLAVSDEGGSGAVDTSLDIVLRPNVSVSNETYSEVYAGEENNTELVNKVTNLNAGGVEVSLNSAFTSPTYYIVLNSVDSKYRLVASETAISGAIGVYKPFDNQLKFKDFWDEEVKNFTVYFQPEGSNYYAIDHPITFTVNRDLKIEDKKGTLYVLGDQSSMGDLVSVTRHSGALITSSSASDFSITYEFSDYFNYTAEGIKRVENKNFFFDYNQKNLSTTLTIKYGSIIFDEIEVNIELINSGEVYDNDVYKHIASQFAISSNDSLSNAIKVDTQKVKNDDKDIEYLVFAANKSWVWKLNHFDNYNLEAGSIDNFGNRIRNYEVSNSNISFKSQTAILAGLNDETKYLVIRVVSSTDGQTYATMHIPYILSSAGYDFVKYNSDKVADDRTLETALLKPEQLLEKGIYNEINAGQKSQILSEYTHDNNTNLTDGGLYTIKNFAQYLENYVLDENYVLQGEDGEDVTIGEKYDDYSSLVKDKIVNKDNINKEAKGYLTLNHLPTSVTDDAFIAFEYILERSSGNRQSFYYLLKVKPDLIVEKPIYAYGDGEGGTTEYIQGGLNEINEVDLEKLYDNKTLHENEKKFMVSKDIVLSGSDNVSSREGVNTILTLDINSNSTIQFTNKGDKVIKEFAANTSPINIDLKEHDYFLDNFDGEILGEVVNVTILKGDASISYNGVKLLSTLKYTNEVTTVVVGDRVLTNAEMWKNYLDITFSNDYRTMFYRPLVSTKMTITIKHSYNGGTKEELSVVGGEQLYTFILNEDAEIFTVEFNTENERVESADYAITLKNGEMSSYSLNINLIKKEESGSTIGTIIYNRLSVNVISGEEFIDSYNYNKATGKFDIILKDYIDSDKVVTFAAYTNVGYLSTFTVNLKANVTYYPNESKTTLNAGMDHQVNGQFISLKQGNDSLEELFKIKSAQISGEGKDFVEFIGNNSFFRVYDLISDMTITIDYVVEFDCEGKSDLSESLMALDGKQFKFTQEYTLKANINSISSFTAEGEIIAGQRHEVDVENLYNTTSSLSENSSITLEATSPNPAFKGVEFTDGKFEFLTGYVSSKVTIELRVEVKIFKGSVSVARAGEIYQSYILTYSFVVAPSVQLELNYPAPNSTANLTNEFVESGVVYENIQIMLNNKAIFSEANRVQIFQALSERNERNEVVYNSQALEDWNNNFDITNFSVVVNSKSSNAKVSVREESGTFKEVSLNGTIDLNKNVKFELTGTSGSEALVELAVTYQSVSKVYYVKIMRNTLQLQLQTVSNYTQAGLYTEENDGKTETNSVSYEKIYVDKTATNKLLAGGRLIQAKLNDTMAGYQDDYYFVFSGTEDGSDNVKYYASFPIFISANDQSKTLYYDLGISFLDKTYHGLYLASKLDKLGISIKGDKRLLQKKNAENQDQDITAEDLKDEKTKLDLDLSASIFAMQNEKPQISLANRIQMTYGLDENGKEILVDYEKYKSIFKGEDIDIEVEKDDETTTFNTAESKGAIQTPSSIKLDEINKAALNLTFVMNDGSIDVETSKSEKLFTLNYYYMASVDIEVAEAASMAGNFITLEVNREYSSLSTLIGIKHPTTNRPISASDFTQGTSHIAFNFIYANHERYSDFESGITEKEYSKEDKDEIYLSELVNSYLNKKDYNIGEFKRSVNDNGSDDNVYNLNYVFRGAISNSNENVYDYTLIPYGAKNTGDYVLGKLVYNVGDFTRVYYVVFKIVSDYVVSFAGSADNATEEENGTIISNFDNVNTISETRSEGQYQYYNDFTLTGQSGYVSIKHKNNPSAGELSTKNFDIIISEDKMIESVSYNKQENLNQKIFTKISSSQKSDWAYNEGAKRYSYNDKDGKDILFNNVVAVIFGDQNYYFEGTDDYGYKYRLYFRLQATKPTPSISNSITITEEEFLDLGAVYQELSITKQSGGQNNYVINSSSPQTPNSELSKVKLLNFQNIETWQFGENYTVPQAKDEQKVYLEIPANKNVSYGNVGYVAKDNSNASEGAYTIKFVNGTDYLKFPMIQFISVESLKLYNVKTNEFVQDINKNTPVTAATDDTSNKKWTFATKTGYFSNENEEVKEGEEVTPTISGPRAVRGKIKEATGNQAEEYDAELWKMPVIQNTDIFEGTNTAQLRLVITLKYDSNPNDNNQDDNDSVIEYCDCPIVITVRRLASFKQAENNVIRDGEAFSVGEMIEIGDNTSGFEIKSFLNDTLEVLVPGNTDVSFNVTLRRNGTNENDIKNVSTSISLQNTGYSWARTYYVSLSQYLGINVKLNDEIKISSVSNRYTQFFYIKNGNSENLEEKTGKITLQESDNTYNFIVSAIQNDIAFVENIERLGSNNYFGINKYYIVNGKYSNDENVYAYRFTANYTVTGYAYVLQKLQTPIAFTIDIKDAGSTESEYNIRLEKWMTDAFKLKRATISNGSITIGEDVSVSDKLQYFSFAIEESPDSSGSSVGNAKITADGVLTIPKSFTRDQYVKIQILMKVSGKDRNIGNDETGDGKVILGTVNVSLKEDLPKA